MYSWEKTGDRVAAVQMNAELRYAQLELLSAQCATDRLRLRYSAEDIAQHAQRDVLNKALLSVTALHDFYSYISRRMEDAGAPRPGNGSAIDEERVAHDTLRLAQYVREQRDLFIGEAQPLSKAQRQPVEAFFSPQFLNKVRIAFPQGKRVAPPAFFSEIRALGFLNLPDFSSMKSFTFEDLLVFQEAVEARRLFHALVHAVQFEILGLQQYSELFIRGFIRTRSYITIPLLTHTLILESKYAAEPSHPFSVEERIRLWVNERRYEKG